MNWGFLKGCIYMAIVIVSYVGTALVIKLTFDEDDEEGYDKPFFTAYTGAGSLSLFIVVIWYQFFIKANWRREKLENKDVRAIEFKAALVSFPIYFGNLAFYYFGLSLTSYSSALLLGNTSSIFAFVFALAILGDNFYFTKMIAVITWAAGVGIVAFSDQKNSEGGHSILGDIFSISQAIFLALYSTLISKIIPKEVENEISFCNILAYIGLLSLATFWPLILIFHYTGIETFELPSGKPLLFMGINILFGTLVFEYWWGKSTMLLGPLLTNTSVILVVQLSMLIDGFWMGDSFSWMYFLGTGLILLGFFIIATKDYFISRGSKNDIEKEWIQEESLTEIFHENTSIQT